MDYCYKFPAVQGVQGGSKYYIAMMPLKMINKLFLQEDDYISPQYRAQRRLNLARIPEITRYIIENRNSYVFSALAASIDGEFYFHSDANNESVGILEIDMDAHFLINDGQHRKAAILEALKEDPTLGNETISVVLYADMGLKRSQQIFTDLNKNAVRTSNSISELYDSRDALAVATKEMILNIDFFKSYTDLERDNLGKYSSNFFTLNSFYLADKYFFGNEEINENSIKLLNVFWNIVAENMIVWKEVQSHQITKVDLRRDYIATQGVVIQALGKLGNYFFGKEKTFMEESLRKLQRIDWKRSSSLWYLRAIDERGKILTNKRAISLITNQIKRQLGIPLNKIEKDLEKTLKEKKR